MSKEYVADNGQKISKENFILTYGVQFGYPDDDDLLEILGGAFERAHKTIKNKDDAGGVCQQILSLPSLSKSLIDDIFNEIK